MANNIIATGTINALGFESEAPHNFAFATWRAIPFSPDGPAVFLDGTKVPIYDGQLDANGDFGGVLIGDTNQMRPPGVSYMFTINPVASVPPITISNVLARAGWAQDLGTVLTAMISPLRIQAAPIVYAYSAAQIINPTAGCGYVNTTDNSTWVFVGAGSVGQWIEIKDTTGSGPVGPQNHIAGFTGAGSGSSFALGSTNLTTDVTGNQLLAPSTIRSTGGQVKAYGNDGSATDINQTNISIGTNKAQTNPLQAFINAPAPVDQRVWSIFTHPTQLFFSADTDSGSNWWWLVVTRDTPGAARLVDMYQKLQVAAPVKANNFLSGTDDTTYLLRLTSAAHNQALLETTNDAEFALLRFQTPSQAWTIGAPGATAPGGATPGSFYLYDATIGRQLFEIDPASGATTLGNPLTAGALTIAPGGGFEGGAAVFTQDGSALDLTNDGSPTVWVSTDGTSRLEIFAAGHQAINFIGAGGNSQGQINTTNQSLVLTSGPESPNGIAIAAQTTTIGDVLGGAGAIKTYRPATISDVTGLRAFSTAYQNTSGMTLCVSMTGLSHGSATGFLASLIGPANPPANRVSRNENTASVEGAECAMTVMVPPGWWYEILSGGDIYGIGGWWEYTCP